MGIVFGLALVLHSSSTCANGIIRVSVQSDMRFLAGVEEKETRRESEQEWLMENEVEKRNGYIFRISVCLPLTRRTSHPPLAGKQMRERSCS